MPLLAPQGWGFGAVSLNRVMVGADWWVRLEGCLRWSANPVGGAVCRHHVKYPAFAARASEMAVGFWPFFVSFCFTLYPTCACVQVIFSPL